MSVKKSVFLSDQTARWVGATTTQHSDGVSGPRWSESINATCEHFRHVLCSAMPELTQDEWQILLNIYAGSYSPAHDAPARIASDMMDNVGAISIDKLDDAEYKALVIKMHKTSQVEQLAVLYFIQIFWSGDWQGYHWETIREKIMEEFS